MRKIPELTILVMASTFVVHAQWVQQKSGTSTELTDIITLDSITAIAVGRDGSILKTTDAGDMWIVLPLPPLFFHPWNAVSFSDRMSGSVVGDFGRVATTTDGGEQWLWHSVPRGGNCLSVLQIGPSNIYVGDDSGWVYHSLDTGFTWSSEHISTWPIRSLFPWTGVYVWGLPIYALTPYSLCSKTDFPSGSWMETILQAFQGLGSEAFRGAFCNGGGAGFIVGVHGDLRAAPAIVRKLISDTTWKTLPTSLLGNGTLFGVSAPSKDAIYVCGSHGMMFNSTDEGDTWSVTSVPTTQSLRAMSFFDERRGFAVGDSGTILYTSNGGATAVGEGEDLLLTKSVLYQNYPNPFNPITNIQFTIVDRQSTTVKVYDLLGREVAGLVNEVKGPGTYTVQFDGSDLSSGLYFYRLETGTFVGTKKFVLLR